MVCQHEKGIFLASFDELYPSFIFAENLGWIISSNMQCIIMILYPYTANTRDVLDRGILHQKSGCVDTSGSLIALIARYRQLPFVRRIHAKYMPNEFQMYDNYIKV